MRACWFTRRLHNVLPQLRWVFRNFRMLFDWFVDLLVVVVRVVCGVVQQRRGGWVDCNCGVVHAGGRMPPLYWMLRRFVRDDVGIVPP